MSNPAPAEPAPDASLSISLADGNSDGEMDDISHPFGDAKLEAVKESGTVVISGNKKDVQKVRGLIKSLEEKSKHPSPSSATPAAPGSAAPMLSKNPMSPSRTRESRVPRKAGQAVASNQQATQSDRLSASIATLDQLQKRSKQLPDGEAKSLDAKFFGGIEDGGEGPGKAGDQFDPITENPFKRVSDEPQSTFSIDVDTASYSKTRDYLLRAGSLPRPDAVRIEELVNYFDYDYQPPTADDKHPFAARMVVTGCPWNQDHRLARIAIKGKTMRSDERPPCNLVFLLDTSGSMDSPNKLPLVIEGMKMLTDQLTDKDRVAITVYAGSAGLVLDSTSAQDDTAIRRALTELSAGGSTNGGQGIALAYHTARENFITDGVNRVILCTDGDFNVGVTGTDQLVRIVEQESKGGIFLSVLGFGMGNHNDAMLEQISGRGNGNYAFIDTRAEAKKVLVDQTNGTLVTIAKDVKLQLEFNPKQVSQYRLIGYENRMLAKEDFNDDKKDAGEIGAGHTVTALYEIVPAGMQADASPPKVDDLKYQRKGKLSKQANSGELLTLKLRYKMPNEDKSTLVQFAVQDDDGDFDSADDDVRFAAAVAGFGMKLRRSKYAGTWTMSDVIAVAETALGDDPFQLRSEFVTMARRAAQFMGEETPQ
ncbi:MAG: VWA domain-containing protein [Pirellulaceae bacterium]|nr:VWA domain-containing protein [Pirellulaceae bacterium]